MLLTVQSKPRVTESVKEALNYKLHFRTFNNFFESFLIVDSFYLSSRTVHFVFLLFSFSSEVTLKMSLRSICFPH